MELKIMNPQEGGFATEIEWNNEELKAEIAAKMTEYETLVFTEDTIKDAKKDRATLNKLKAAFEDERKRIKKLYMDPYNKFEAQVKEVVALIERPIGLIDSQIKEVEENKRQQKLKDIEELFQGIGFQTFVTLEKIFDSKWLNATVSMNSIEEQMKHRMYEIGTDVVTISKLPEFGFEAMEVYKETLDMNRAIQEGQRLAEIQRRKAEQEEAARQASEAASAAEAQRQQDAEKEKAAEEKAGTSADEPVYTLDFRVTATKTQLDFLKSFLKEHKIAYGPVPTKEGE